MLRRSAAFVLSAIGVLTLAGCSLAKSSAPATTAVTAQSKNFVNEKASACLVRRWQIPMPDFTDSASGMGPNFSGRLILEFKSNGTFSMKFDDASTTIQEGGRTFTVTMIGSIDGTYKVTKNQLRTNPTDINIDALLDGRRNALLSQELKRQLQSDSLAPTEQPFTCSPTSLVIEPGVDERRFTPA